MKSLSNKQINYYKVFNQKPELSQSKKTAISLILPIAIIAVVGATILSIQYREISNLTKQIVSENAYINDINIKDKYNEYLKISSTISETSVIADDLKASSEALSTYPEINSTLLEYVYAHAGETIDITSISYQETGASLVFTANSKDVFDAISFARSLEKIEAFYNVDYTGYMSDDESVYHFIMFCTPNGRNAAEQERLINNEPN